MYTYEYKVTFSDCDPGGVIYFASVFDIAHRAYEEFIESARLSRNYFEDSLLAIPIVKAEAEYHKPIKLHELIKVNLSVEKTGETSYTLHYLFLDAEGNTKAVVKTIHVVIEKSTRRKTNFPEELKEFLKTHC